MTVDQVSPSDEPKGTGITAEAAVKAIKAGRKKDVDIAAQIVSDYAGQMDGETWSVEEEKRLIRRIDWRLIPTVRTLVTPISMHGERNKKIMHKINMNQLFVCATLSGLDKTAISAAAIYNIKTDLNLSGDQYSWIGSAPFFGGLVFMGPLAYCLQKYDPIHSFQRFQLKISI